MKFLCSACHAGQAKALDKVTAALIAQGHTVAVVLELNSPATALYQRDSNLFDQCGVIVLEPTAIDCEMVRMVSGVDAVLVMLSPTAVQQTAEQYMYVAARALGKPAYGFSEVVCGHMAPVWKSVLPNFTTLFVAKRTEDLRNASNVVDVGMEVPTINPITGMKTKRDLGFRENDPLLWFVGAPYSQSAITFRLVLHAVHALRCQTSGLDRLSVVFSRHSRDKGNDDSVRAHREAVQFARSVSIPLVENSADHSASETTDMQRGEIMKYSALFEACSLNGLIFAAGHGTDAIKAPCCGIPSLLCVGDTLNPHIGDEKGCQELPLPTGCPHQITVLDAVEDLLANGLLNRDDYRAICRSNYPVQTESPAKIIVAQMTKA